MDQAKPTESHEPPLNEVRQVMIGSSMILVAGVAMVLGGCAVAPTTASVMVLPGSQKSTEQFGADSTTCQEQARALLADDAQTANNHAMTNAAIGTIIGAAAGALLGQGSPNPSAAAGWGAGTGLLIGGTVGGSNLQVASYTMQQRFDTAYVQCMYQRGHRVPSQAGYMRHSVPSPVPSFPPPNYPPPNYPPPDSPPPNYHPLNYPPPY